MEVRLKYCVTLSSPPVRMPLGVLNAHLLDRIDQDGLGFGHRIFGGMIHRLNQLIGLLAHAEHAQGRLGLLQITRQWNLHLVVAQKAAILAEA